MENISRSLFHFAQKYQGILKMVGAVVAFLLTLGTLINLINISGFMGLSTYPVFAEIMYSCCQILYILFAIAGFCTLGIMLLLKPKHPLVPIALIVLAAASLFGAAEDTFYYIWQSSNYFSFYFNAETGDKLKVSDLFAEGWERETEYFVVDDDFNVANESIGAGDIVQIDLTDCRIADIQRYTNPPYSKGDLSDLEWPVSVFVVTKAGAKAAVSVPREYIK